MRALVTGATGQDGQYLCELLIRKGYDVHALRRPTTGERRDLGLDVTWHDADMSDVVGIRNVMAELLPDEIYNLAAQSHVGVSFQHPILTFQVNAIGAMALLDSAINMDAKFYQASTSELFGASPPPQNETTAFHPSSPYAVAKLAAYWATVNAREAYDTFACNGILFNHESPRRGPDFVTRKITRAVAEFAHGRTEPLRLGNIHARRDWGHARDYVYGMWLMMKQDKPDDYVLATGETHSVQEFLDLAFSCIGKRWQDHVVIDEKFNRPLDVPALCGDATKARKVLGWKPTTTFPELVAEMVASDMERLCGMTNSSRLFRISSRDLLSRLEPIGGYVQ